MKVEDFDGMYGVIINWGESMKIPYLTENWIWVSLIDPYLKIQNMWDREN